MITLFDGFLELVENLLESWCLWVVEYLNDMFGER